MSARLQWNSRSLPHSRAAKARSFDGNGAPSAKVLTAFVQPNKLSYTKSSQKAATGSTAPGPSTGLAILNGSVAEVPSVWLS